MSTITSAAIYWAEIPVTDLVRAKAFYEAVTGATFEVEESGPNPVAYLGKSSDLERGAGGHLYPGTPAQNGEGPTIHLAIDGTVEEAAERLTAAGGTLVGPVIEIPVGRFQYAIDLDGNSIGLFQAAS